METAYKNHSFIISSELDPTTNQWNGRYRIMNDEGVVVYESFVDPNKDESAASNNAEKEAKAWIDEQYN